MRFAVSLESYKLEILNEIRANPNSLPQLTDELSGDGEFILEALKITPNVWDKVSNKLKSNKKFMLLAIEQDSDAFIFGASEELKNDEEVALSAVRKDSKLLFYVSDRLKIDESFKDKATKTNSWFPILRFNKFLKNSFSDGVSDTFAIMLGDYGLLTKMDGAEFSSNRYKYGLVDLTLIPLLSNALINYGLPNRPSTNNPFRYIRDETRWNDMQFLRNIALGIGFGLQAIRLGLAGVATLMVLPIVAAVHIIKFPYVAFQQHKLFNLQGEIYAVGDTTPKKISTLGEFAKETNSSLTDFCAPHFSGTKADDITTVSSQNSEQSSYGSMRSTSTLLFFRPTNINSPTQKKALQVLKNLEINDDYDVNDFEHNAIGRSFI